ncbi:hypothetical protein FRC06_008858, partial [Ceratobasidium sp. 370]
RAGGSRLLYRRARDKGAGSSTRSGGYDDARTNDEGREAGRRVSENHSHRHRHRHRHRLSPIQVPDICSLRGANLRPVSCSLWMRTRTTRPRM